MNSVDSHATVARHVKTAVLAVCTGRGGRMCMYDAGDRGTQIRTNTYDVQDVRQGQRSRGAPAGMGAATGGPRGNGRNRPFRRCSSGGRRQGARQTVATRGKRRGGSRWRSKGMRRGGGRGWDARRLGVVGGGRRRRSGGCGRGRGSKRHIRRGCTKKGGMRGHV